MCVCVRESERERERESLAESEFLGERMWAGYEDNIDSEREID